MSTDINGLHISSCDSVERVDLARDILTIGTGVVAIDGAIALRPEQGKVICEVISCPSNSHFDSKNIQVLAEALISQSGLAHVLRGAEVSWVLVEDYGSGTMELSGVS